MLSNSSSSPEVPFTPRREFIRHEQKLANTFSLLAIAGSNCLRLYSFPLPVIVQLRRFFDQANFIAGFREDATNNFCEFMLDGRPWNSPKSVATERLLIEVLAIIYLHGYTYLSTVDYGREPDDRLVMTFSKPTGRSDSPASPTTANQSKSSISDNSLKAKRAPFALSFPSSTILRVVCPPLDSTPAILQAVRKSWPRGVVSEKKIGDNTFEFKLKGYRWFQKDTFAVDSLRHILSLLSSLDTHSFTLLASISLTSRSRVKDLWLFTGPAASEDVAYPDSPAPSANTSQTDIKRPVYSSELPPYHPPHASNTSPHRRLATEPVPLPHSPSPLQHVRAVTEDIQTGSPMRHAVPATSPTTLRKPAPRAQLPVSVHDEGDVGGDHYRAQLPSTVPSGVVNMTGVGATQHAQTPDIFYSTSPFHNDERNPVHPAHDSIVDPVYHPRTPTPKSAHTSSRPHTEEIAVVDRSIRQSEAGTPPLLSPGVFRDSAFSSNTEMSSNISIKWTGVGTEPLSEEVEPTPDFPGGWQPTPVEEKAKDTEFDITLDQSSKPEQPIQDVLHRVASPAFSEGDDARKSETGLIGMVSAETDTSGKGKEKEKDTGSGGQGWVLVNVQGQPPPSESPVAQNGQTTGKGKAESPATSSPEPASQDFPKVSNSPVAKAIVIMDAVDSKKKKKSKSEQTASQSRMRKFFSLSRKDSKRIPAFDGDIVHSDMGKEMSSDSNSSKLKNTSTPEVSRKTGRRSIDG